MGSTTASAMPFQGFSREAIDFLAELAQNNDRAWFQPRKAEYERLLKGPLEALCADLANRFRARDLPLVSDAGRSPFRIYRDVRFSHDKSPYKTQVSAMFPYREGGGQTSFHEHGNPGGYFHFEPGNMFVGGGMWHPDSPIIAAFRRAVAADPRALRGIIDEPSFRREFGMLSGEMLTRVPSGLPADHPEAELLKLKDVTFGRKLADEEVTSPALVDTLVTAFEAAVPLMRYLAAATAPVAAPA